MANKKINELDSRSSLSLSDLMAVGDPSTGYLYKTTISDLKTLTGAGVVSFNGRFGSVVPAEGDYSLTQLSDVIITSASNNQVLRYNGSNWVNATIDLSGYVPYTGATGNVNLGSNTLLAAQIKATSSAGLSINANSGTQIADLGAGGGANMTLFGGLTGTSASFSSSVTGNTIVKTGGTSSQFLKADGSVDSSTYLTTSAAASTYLPLTGGTLTGALITNSTITASGLFSNPNAPIAGLIHLKHGTQFDGATGFSAIGATASNQFFFKHGISTNAFYLSSASITTERTYTLPDASGTLALTSQLHDAVTIGTANGLSLSGQVLSLALASTSATGALSSTDWNTFNGKQAALNGTGFVKISGTTISYDNSTYLTTASAASTYLPLAGGTLTGALNGTSAVFSSTVQASAYRLTGMTAGSGALYWTSDRVTLANYNATGKVHIEANGGTGVATFGGATYNSDFVGTGRFTGDLYAETGVFSLGLFTSDETKSLVPGGVSSLTTLYVSGDLIVDTNTLYVDSTNNRVGIGTTSPANKLTISNNGNAAVAFRINDTNANASFLSFNASNTDAALIAGGTSAIPFDIYTGGVARMSITSSGNVGISTSSIPNNLGVALQLGPTVNLMSFVGNAYFLNNWYYDSSGNAKYITSSFASGITQNGSGEIRFFTMPSGTANNSFTPTERLMITNGGNVLIGTTSSNNHKLEIVGGSTSGLRIDVNSGTSGIAMSPGAEFNIDKPGVGGGAFKIQSNGNVLVGTTNDAFFNGSEPGIMFSGGNGFIAASRANSTCAFFNRYSSTGDIVQIRYAGSNVGSISYNGSLTLYNATSDYRLKEDLKDYNALDIINQLKTYNFKWKKAGIRDYGMIAHELQEILPNYVNGEKDSIDENGIIIPQGVDYSKIVPILVKAIQELNAKIKNLKNN
jgi:hypothetical protein